MVIAAALGHAEESSIPFAVLQTRDSGDKSAGNEYAVWLNSAIGNLQRSLATGGMDNPRKELDELNLAYLEMLRGMLGKPRAEMDEAIKAWNDGPCGRRVLELSGILSHDASLENLTLMKKRLAGMKSQENKSEDMIRAISRLEKAVSMRESALARMPSVR